MAQPNLIIIGGELAGPAPDRGPLTTPGDIIVVTLTSERLSSQELDVAIRDAFDAAERQLETTSERRRSA